MVVVTSLVPVFGEVVLGEFQREVAGGLPKVGFDHLQPDVDVVFIDAILRIRRNDAAYFLLEVVVGAV